MKIITAQSGEATIMLESSEAVLLYNILMEALDKKVITLKERELANKMLDRLEI